MGPGLKNRPHSEYMERQGIFPSQGKQGVNITAMGGFDDVTVVITAAYKDDIIRAEVPMIPTGKRIRDDSPSC